jgi:hypothetical protein
MKLYLIYRTDEYGYDEYDEAVVCAESEEEARNIHPREGCSSLEGWIEPKDVKVSYLGEAEKGWEKGVICASFNAG